MIVASKYAQIGESATVLLADRIRDMESAGHRVIKLQTGDPDFATPQPIVEAVNRAIRDGQTHYSNSKGLPSLREAIADRIKAESDVIYNPASEVQITHGGVHGVFITLSALVDRGDEVVVIDPSWMPYVSSCIMAGGTPVRVPTKTESGFRIDPDLLEQSITPRSKVLVINSPCNPTGVVYSPSELSQLAEIAERHDLVVVSDEVYEKLIYDESEHVRFSSLPGMKERTITVNSLSKTYAMSGWRVGYVTGPENLMHEISKVSQYSITNLAPFVQIAALTALTHVDVQREVDGMVSTYLARRNRIARVVETTDGLCAAVPQGAFYVMLDISKRFADSGAFATDLLLKRGVGVVPGTGFGSCAEGTVRMTFAASNEDIEEGLARLIEHLDLSPGNSQ